MMKLLMILVAWIAPLLGTTIDPIGRAADLERGTILFTYPARPGVTGNADMVMVAMGGLPDERIFVRGRYEPGMHGHAGEIAALCRVRDGRIRDVEFSVLEPGARRPRADRDLGGMGAREAVEFFFALVETGGADVVDAAVLGAAIAAGAWAEAPLLTLARDRSASGELRGQALFWLAVLAGERAIDPLDEVIDAEDEDLELREQAVFALSRLDEQKAFPLLMEIARNHPNPAIRRSAFLPLSRFDRPEVVNLFEEILVGDSARPRH